MQRQFAILALTLALCGIACSDGTTGKRIILRTQVEPAREVHTRFTTLSGWNVELAEAALATGPFYYFDGSPAFVMQQARTPWQGLKRVLLPLAHAHPGHYGEGMAKGQMLMESSLSLLAGPVAFPAGNGVTGLYRSATFSFSSPVDGPALTSLKGNTVTATGLATKGESTVHFRIAVDFATIGERARDGLVPGCSFEEDTVDRAGVVKLTIKPHVWFNLVDFADIAPGSAEAPTEITKGSTAHIAFVLGLVQLSAYHFSFTPDHVP